MSFKSQLAGAVRLVVDHYTRHPKTSFVSIHCLQIDDTDKVIGGTEDFQAPVSEVDELIESDEIQGMDAGVSAWVASHTGLPTTPDQEEQAEG